MHALEIGVVDLDFGGAEIGDVEEAVSVDLGGSHALVDRAVRGAFVGVVHFEDGIGGAGWRISAGIPARDGAVFRGKDEDGLRARFAGHEKKVGTATVEDHARWGRLSTGREARRRNGDDQRTTILFWRERVTFAVVEGRGAGVVVRHPPGAAGGARETPRVLQVGVDGRSHPGDVGDEIRLFVMLRLRYKGEQEKRKNKYRR